MKSENKIRQPLLIVFATAVILILASFIPYGGNYSGIEIKHVDILSDLKPAPDYEEVNNSDYNGRTTKPEQKSEMQYQQASIASFGNFDKLTNKFVENETAKIDNAVSLSHPTMHGAPIRGDLGQLSYFFSALKKTKNDVVRVAHYGDSAIEGDLITADLREYLRNKNLGGEGVGFLGITSQDIRFRSTTEQSFSDNWESASLYSSNPQELPLGISGEIFIPKGNCWVEYKTKRGFSSVRDFSSVRVFYSHAKSSSIKYSFNDGQSKSARLSPGNGLQELVIKNDGNARKVRIEFEPDQAYFYGVSLENGNGLYVDNLPLRGNSGVDLQKIPESMLKDFHKFLNYKLIILEFGLNIAGSSRSNYSWYEREMTQVINRFKKTFPNTSILMITVHDKSMKRGTQFVTDPSILKLLETQKNIAEKNNVAYWNLFEAMGGENSMPKWVSSNPPLAFRDYIHFNEQGAQKIAKMLGEAIWDAYNK